MPPALDVYVMTRQRDRETIEQFLDGFVDRAASAERWSEGLLMVARPTSAEEGGTEEWVWESTRTLAQAIERGLEFPRRAFTVYLTAKSAELDRAYLAFTTDDDLILGVALDDTDERPENARRARQLLHEIAEQCGAFLGVVLVEQPPPLREQAFYQSERVPLTVYFWRR